MRREQRIRFRIDGRGRAVRSPGAAAPGARGSRSILGAGALVWIEALVTAGSAIVEVLFMTTRALVCFVGLHVDIYLRARARATPSE